MSKVHEGSGYCVHCERRVLVRRQAGLIGTQRWRCTQCGTPTLPESDLLPWAVLAFKVAAAALLCVIAVLVVTSLVP